VGDWDSGSYKGQCPLGEAITGLSRYATASNHQAHAVQCGSLTVGNSGTLFGCNERTFDPGDNRGADFNWDWDSGYFKAECSPGEFVQGVAQSTSGTLDGILCCAGVVSHSACDVQVFDSHNSSAYGRPDWDYGYYKGQCPKGQYVAGVSAFAGSPQGAPHAILCCSP
jgi:hypothetical protein